MDPTFSSSCGLDEKSSSFDRERDVWWVWMRTQEGTRSLVSRGYQLWSPHFEADNNSHTFNLFFNNIRLLCLHDLPPRYWVCCLLPFPIHRISSRRALQGSQTSLPFHMCHQLFQRPEPLEGLPNVPFNWMQEDRLSLCSQ